MLSVVVFLMHLVAAHTRKEEEGVSMEEGTHS